MWEMTRWVIGRVHLNGQDVTFGPCEGIQEGLTPELSLTPQGPAGRRVLRAIMDEAGLAVHHVQKGEHLPCLAPGM